MKFLRFIIVFWFVAFSSSAQSQESTLRAYLDMKQFYAPGSGDYMEFYFQFIGPTISYKGVQGGLQGELAISLLIKDEKGDVANQTAYRLQTPIMRDSIVEDFYELKRVLLKPGNYTLDLKFEDLNTNASAVTASQKFVVDATDGTIFTSDIEAIEYAYKGDETSSFYKSGYTIFPRLTSFYPKELSKIPVYFELYNTNLLEDSICGLKQSIFNLETNTELSDYTVFSKLKTAAVIPQLKTVDIAKIPSGKYALNYTLLSRSMKELTTQTYTFERSNDIEQVIDFENLVLDPAFQASISNDSVAFYLASLYPIAKNQESRNISDILKTKDLQKQRRHIQAFWLVTAPKNAYEAWLKYKGQVQLVQRLYSNNFQDGFETDRGRVYLQFGSPSSLIVRETSASEYPYEIWQYDKIGIYSNRRFIFYNPDLVNNTHRLLHSDMLGEIKNQGWQQVLVKRHTDTQDVDNPNGKVQRQFGDNSYDLFRQY